MTPARIAELRQLCEKATAGPWKQDSETYPDWRTMWHQFDVPLSKGGLKLHWTACVCHDEPLFTAVVGNGPNSEANAAFIAAAREFVPEALDEIERLRAALTKAADDMESIIGYVPEYFQDKWEMADDVKAARDALRKP